MTEHKKLKKILLVNDVAGYGKVGMAAMLPILSYLGIPAFNLPTALVSNTLDYGDFAQLDTTGYMRQTLPIWKKLGFRFDAICTGLMFSEEQARLVAQFCREQAEAGCTIYVDPVMGDGGRLYNGIGEEQVRLMREMVGVAHLIFPNYTEACYLADIPFQKDGLTRQEACALLDRLTTLGPKSVLITSCFIDNKNQVCGFDAATGKYFFHDYDEIPGIFHGTGDIFSAVLIGHLMKQESLSASTRQAMDVVREMIYRNRDVDDRNCGIFIERCLDLL
jgi:pyridoxine kinase